MPGPGAPGAPSTLWLVGMMGSGKSSVGRLVAEKASAAFVDTDDLVMNLVGAPISDFWREHGEAAFRDAEESVVEGLAGAHAVVAAGGGVVLRLANIEAMQRSGTVIWLRADASVLGERIGDGAGRPLLEDVSIASTLDDLLETRQQAYASAADHSIETGGKSVEEVAEEVLTLWN